MKIEPVTIRFPVERSKTDPDIGFLAALKHTADQLQSGGKTQIAACANVQIANFDMQVALVQGQELFVILPIRIFAYVLKWRHHIVSDDVIGIERSERFEIFLAERFRKAIEPIANTCLRCIFTLR